MAKLTGSKKAWADEHVGVYTQVIVSGPVTSYDLQDDGTVLFMVTATDGTTATFLARPPLSEAEQAALDKQRAKEAEEQTSRLEQDRIDADEQARQAAENARQEVLAQMREIVGEVVDEKLAAAQEG